MWLFLPQLILLWGCASLGAQTLTVHTVREATGKPISGVPVTIRYNFLEPRGAKKGEVKTVKSDSNGMAVFPDLHLDTGGFSVSVFSMGFRSGGLEPVFFPEGAASPKLSNPTYSKLPAEVTIVAHRNSFGEVLQLIYPGP
jgi:hypothetical protein